MVLGFRCLFWGFLLVGFCGLGFRVWFVGLAILVAGFDALGCGLREWLFGVMRYIFLVWVIGVGCFVTAVGCR